MQLIDPGDPFVMWQTREHATCTRHRKYALDCEQFDSLIRRARGCCELCGIEGDESAWGLLRIDHEHQVGQWAVRGLLCDACNCRLQRGRRLPATPPLLSYIANAWYRQEAERLGLGVEEPAELGLGSRVMLGRRVWVRLDDEVECCWGARHGKITVTTKSWRQIWYEQGPFHFRVIQERESISKWDLDLYKPGLHHIQWAKKRATLNRSA